MNRLGQHFWRKKQSNIKNSGVLSPPNTSPAVPCLFSKAILRKILMRCSEAPYSKLSLDTCSTSQTHNLEKISILLDSTDHVCFDGCTLKVNRQDDVIL
jgi:hypothetical protein